MALIDAEDFVDRFQKWWAAPDPAVRPSWDDSAAHSGRFRSRHGDDFAV